MDIQKDKDFTSLPEIAKLYQACKERDLTIAEREYLKGARDAWQAAKAQAVPEGFVLVKMDDLELLRDSALEIKYASLNNDSDRIFSDIEDIQLSVERLIEAQEQNQ